MFCRNCQTIIPDDSIFCENCGAPTGLTPTQPQETIDDSNLVPEEAVEFEVSMEENSATNPVPVDPVWWEPPEEPDAPIDVEARAVFEDAEDSRIEGDGEAGPEAGQEAEAEREFAETEAEPSQDEEAESRDRAAQPEDEGEEEADESITETVTEAVSETFAKAGHSLMSALRSARAGLGSIAAHLEGDAVKDEHPEEDRLQAPLKAEMPAEAETEAETETEAGMETEGMEADAKKAEEAEHPQAGEALMEEGGPVEAEGGGEPKEGETASGEEGETPHEIDAEKSAAEAGETDAEMSSMAVAETGEGGPGPADREAVTEEDGPIGLETDAEESVSVDGNTDEDEPDAGDRGPDQEIDTEDEDTESPAGPELTEEAEEASDAADTAKAYAVKAADRLKILGRKVRAGTGLAAEAAKETLQQKREEYQEKREQREQQKEEERKSREREQKRRERERQKQEEQLEREQRAEGNIVQQEGFWYGDDMPEPTIPIRPAVKAGSGEEPDDQQGSGPQQTSDVHLIDVPLKAGDGRREAEGEIPASTEAAGTDRQEPSTSAASSSGSPAPGTSASEKTPEETSEKAPEETPAAEPDLLPEEEIEDKLADTAKFDWSRADLEAAAAEAAEADEEDRAQEDGGEDGSGASEAGPASGEKDGGEDAKGDGQGDAEGDKAADSKEEESHPDEPAIYRIKDFGAGVDLKQKRSHKSLLKTLGIIAIIILCILGVAALMVHQHHVKQEEEAAYQAALVKAAETADAKKYEDAEAEYLALIEQRPEDTAPWLGLLDMYMDQQRYVDAKALIKRAVEATGDEETFKPYKKNIKFLTSRKWKKAYIKVLEDNETDIKRYEEDVAASVAVCDVNGDRRPELFFFTEEYYGYGKLHIYTTVDNKAKEINYECENRGTQYHDAFYDVASFDSSYAIFNMKDEGRFAIYANIDHDGRSWDTINEYKMNTKGGCKQLMILEAGLEPTYDEDEEDQSKYLQDDEDITYDKYIDEFNRVLGQSREVILYNGSEGDQGVWAKVTADNVMCMSYNNMMTDLKAK